MSRYQELNDTIIELFGENKPFSVIRIGNTEGYFLETFYKRATPSTEFYSWLAYTSSVYPLDDYYLRNVWYEENLKYICNTDMLGFVDFSGEIAKNVPFMEAISKIPTIRNLFTGLIDISILDPGAILDESKIKNPWTKQLKGKNVLIVSCFEQSIKSQWENIDLVWGDNKNNIVPFNLVDVVRTPFHPDLDDRQYPNCKTSLDTIEYLKGIIDSYDYDVLLVGAASLSPAIADHAKRSGKIGITICGSIQMFFGILGTRWIIHEGNEGWKNSWGRLYNEHWKYPLEIDLPQNKHLFEQIEKSYW